MRDILIIICFLVILFLVFIPSYFKPQGNPKELTGIIYDASSETETIEEPGEIFLQPAQVTKVIPAAAGPSMGKKEEKKESIKARIERVVRERKRKEKEKIVQVVQEVQKPTPTPATPTPKPHVIDYESIHQIVGESNRSYFYQLQQESSDVIIHLISYTPYNDKGILKVKIENNSRSYFFYSSISVQGISTQVFGSQFAKSGGSSVLYLLLNNITTKSGLVLNVVEQQAKRTFKINFFIP